jgi:hypothetical protein
MSTPKGALVSVALRLSYGDGMSTVKADTWRQIKREY